MEDKKINEGELEDEEVTGLAGGRSDDTRYTYLCKSCGFTGNIPFNFGDLKCPSCGNTMTKLR